MSSVIMKEINKRNFIRHPSDIPIEYCFSDKSLCLLDSINDVSIGGLSFSTSQYIEPNSSLHVHIPINDNHFEIDVIVKWCRQTRDTGFDIGVVFIDDNEAYTARMVEQVCHIEQYKNDVLRDEGRTLNGDQAAAEWISKYAKDFPH